MTLLLFSVKFMLNVTNKSFTLSVVMINVVLPSVVAPPKGVVQ